MSKAKKRPDPESEEAIREVAAAWGNGDVVEISWYRQPKIVIEIGVFGPRCVINLRKLVRRRAALKGIRKAEKELKRVVNRRGK